MAVIGGLRTARWTGCLVGIALALALFVISRPAAGGEAAGAEVSLHANLTGELLVTPAAPTPFLRERALRPGDPAATGSFSLTNQTGGILEVSLVAVPEDPSADGVILVSLRSGDGLLLSGPLGSTAAGAPLRLGPGETSKIDASASLAPGVDRAEAAAALAEVNVALESTPLGGNGS